MKWVGYDRGVDSILGYVARQTRVTDVWGNYRLSPIPCLFWKETLDSLVCPPPIHLSRCTTEVVRNGKYYVELLWNTGNRWRHLPGYEGFCPSHKPTKDDGYFPAAKNYQCGYYAVRCLFSPERTDAGPVFNQKSKCQFIAEYEDFVIRHAENPIKSVGSGPFTTGALLTDTQCVPMV